MIDSESFAAWVSDEPNEDDGERRGEIEGRNKELFGGHVHSRSSGWTDSGETLESIARCTLMIKSSVKERVRVI